MRNLKTGFARLARPVIMTGLVASSALLTGCALSPQIITLDSDSAILPQALVENRTALVRVRDMRDSEYLGNRGGLDPQQSLLVAEPTLEVALTQKMQSALKKLGFGGQSDRAPMKIEILINAFHFQCNQGIVVNSCGLDIELQLNAKEGGYEFSKPFSLSEERSVIASPRTGFNQEWINQSIDKIWGVMFNDPEVQKLLAN